MFSFCRCFQNCNDCRVCVKPRQCCSHDGDHDNCECRREHCCECNKCCCKCNCGRHENKCGCREERCCENRQKTCCCECMRNY